MSEAKIKLRVDGAGSAKSDIQSVADKFDSLADSAKGAFGGLAAGLSAGALANWVKGAIDAADNLNDLSKSTAISVEQLAGLEAAAKKSGGELDSVASSINKLSVNMGKDAEKFAKLGITAKEPLEAFKQLADVYKSIEDPQRRAAFAADALGKSWEGAAPLLNEGGKAIGEMVEKGTRLSGVTQQLADDSDKFNDSLVDLSTAATGLKMKIASDLLPGMTSFLETVTLAYEETGKLETAWVALGGLGALVFTDEFDSDTKKLQNLRQELTDLTNEQTARKATYDVDGVLVRFLFGGYTAEELAAQIEYVKYTAAELEKKIKIDSTPKPKDPANVKPQSPIGSGGDLASVNADVDRAIKARAAFIASLEKERVTLGQTTEQNKLYEASLLGIKGRQLDLVKAKLSEIELKKAQIKEDERLSDIAKQAEEDHKRFVSSLVDGIGTLRSQAEAQREYNDRLGLSKDAINELEIAKLEDQAITKDGLALEADAIDSSGKVAEAYRAQAEELRNLAKLKREGLEKESAIDRESAFAEQAKRDFEKLQDESQKFTDSLYEGLSDSLYRGFEDGKGFGKSMRDSIVNLFKTNAIKITAQVITTGILGLGGIGQASAGQQSNNIFSDATSLVSAGKSLFNGFSSASAASSSAFTSFATSSLGQSLGLSIASTAEAAAAAEVAALTGSSIGTAALPSTLTATGSAGASVASAMPYVAAAVAAFQGVKAINGDYRIGGLSGDAGALLGFAPRLFGMKEKELGGQTVTGTLGTDNLMRNQSWTQDGGLFRSDRSGVWSYGLKDSTAIQDGKAYTDTASLGSDKELLMGLNAGYDAIKLASADFAKTLGLNADDIAKRNDAINLTLGKTGEETQAAIQKAFADIADQIALEIAPGIKEFAKAGESTSVTLSRMATGLAGVNNVITSLGIDSFAKSLDGAGAAQRLIELSGGIEAFSQGSAYFAENFLSEAEKIKPSIELVGKTLADLGLSNLKTIEDFKLAIVGGEDAVGNIVEALDLTTEAGAKTYAQLIAIAPQFKAVADYAEFSSEALKKKAQLEREAAEAERIASSIAQERLGLQERYNQLTLTSAELIDLQRNALAEVNRELFDSVIALEKQQAAEQEAFRMASAIAQERIALQNELNQLTMTESQLQNLKRESYAEQNRDIYDQIQLERSRAAEELQSANLQKQAAEEAASAASEFAQAWNGVAESISKEVERIRGTATQSTSQSLASAQARFSIAQVQSLAGDADAAKQLPALSQALLQIAEQQAPTLDALNRLKARTAESLEAVSNKYGASKANAANYSTSRDPGMVITQNDFYNASQALPVSPANAESPMLVALQKVEQLLEQILTPTIEMEKSIGVVKRNIQNVTQDGRAMQVETAES